MARRTPAPHDELDAAISLSSWKAVATDPDSSLPPTRSVIPEQPLMRRAADHSPADASSRPRLDRRAHRTLALTPRECDVVRGIVDGRTNRAIAFELGITEQSVKN